MENSMSKMVFVRKSLLLCVGLLLLNCNIYAQQVNGLASNYLSPNKGNIITNFHKPSHREKQETVTGTVTDAKTGTPLIGVNILVVGTSNGTATDADGHYSLSVSSLQDTLRFSYIGYQMKAVPINGRTNINVALKSSISDLDQVVVIGFGTQTKRNIVGAVSSVEMSSIDKVQASTFNQKLQGKVSGVNVSTSSGRLGAPVRINIRGTSSVNASSQPLYVIDGVPVVTQTLAGGGGVTGVNGSVNPFLNLSSNNIKSIQILKGASAAAIYGTRGANGVILITTKDGSGVQGNSLSINVSGGITHVANKLSLLNGPEYLKIYNYKRGTNYSPSDYPVNTDWQDAVTRTGSFEKYNVSMAGGSDKNTYFISGNYKNATGMLLSNSLKKFNAYLKLHHNFNDHLSVDASIMPSVSYTGSLRGRGQVGSAFGFGMLEPPTVPIYALNGTTLNDGVDPSIPGNTFSPFPGTPYANLKGMNIDNTTKQALSTIGVDYDFTPNLSLKSTFGYQFLDNLVNVRFNKVAVGGYPNGLIGVSTQSFTNSNWNNTLTYKKDWQKNSLEITLAATLEKNVFKNSNATRRNVPGSSLNSLNTGASIAAAGGAITSFTYQNNVVRISYNYDEKYLLTLTGSYDGTSRFAEGKRYGFFPSIGVGWIISDEDFIQNFQALSFLKLQVSYGVTGNANIGNFDYLPLLNAGVSYYNEPGLVFSQLANLGLTWERGNEYDIGLNFGFFNGGLTGKIDYYNKITTDLLLQRRVSNINGFTSIFKNGGKMTNQGIEFNFDADVIRTRGFLWNISGNIATLQNKVKALPGGEIISSPNIVREGEPVAAFYMPVYKGVDPQNGDALYADGNGGTTSSYSLAAREIVGYPQPKFYGGFGTSLSFKGLDFSIAFNYSYGNKLYWSGAQYLIGGSSIYNQSSIVLDAWTPSNRNTNVPEARKGSNGNNTSSRFLYDGSYLRLKTLQIGYTLTPSGDLGGIQSIRIYLGGTNLLTLTGFPGLDPEGTTSSTSNISQGVIDGSSPPAIVINGGIQIKM